MLPHFTLALGIGANIAIFSVVDAVLVKPIGGGTKGPCPTRYPNVGTRVHDAASVLEKITCPILAYFGDLDLVAPVRENKELMEQALKKGGNADYTIIVLPDAEHGFLEARTGSRRELPQLKRFVPGFFDTMIDWTLERVRRFN